MTQRLLTAGIGLALALAPLHGAPGPQRPATGGGSTEDGATGAVAREGLTWRTDLAAAVREAARERRPLLAVFR